MKRLTEQDGEYAYYKGCTKSCGSVSEECGTCEFYFYDACKKLAAYEKTWLEPEEVMALKEKLKSSAEVAENLKRAKYLEYIKKMSFSEGKRAGIEETKKEMMNYLTNREINRRNRT